MDTHPIDSPRPDLRRIVVVGSGIAGAEAALTLAIGVPDAQVTLVGRWPSVRILPDLVYVPFEIAAQRIDMPVDALLPHGVHSVVADVLAVDATRRRLTTTAGELEFDVLIAAPGAVPIAGSTNTLRTLDDALRIRAELAALVADAREGERRTITIRSESEDAWTAPACEFALLLGAWLRSQRLETKIETLLATVDHDAFEWFGPVGEATVESALRRARVQLATGVPAGRFDALGGDLVVNFGQLEAAVVPGLPGHATSGWYETGSDFSVAPDVYVIGDALNLPYRAGFATAWQARRVLEAVGGDLSRLGADIDGIPSGSVEYQMDLADGVMRARIGKAAMLGHPFLGHDADITVAHGARPDKLAGLLLHDRILQWDASTHDAPLAFRDALRRSAAA